MHRSHWLAVLAVASTLAVPALAGDGNGALTPQHGGTVSATDAYRFEAVFERGGLRVYPLTRDGKPVPASSLSGTATFYHPGSPAPWFTRNLRRGTPSADRRPTTLGLPIDLGSVPETGARVAFRITGLPDAAEPTAEFTTPVRFPAPATPVRFAAPAPLVFTVATGSDQKAIAAQRVCRVSGGRLGSMGVPIKASRGASSTFLCCRGCMAKVQAEPDRYLSQAGPTR
jgi:hypothetical protein